MRARVAGILTTDPLRLFKGRFSRFFVRHGVEERVKPLAESREIPEASVYGLGCASTAGPSLGAPIDVLAMHCRQVLVNRLLGISKAICLVVKNGSGESSLERKLIQDAFEEHQQVARIFAAQLADIEVEVMTDWELRDCRTFRKVASQPLSSGNVPHYFEYQDQLFETLRQLHGATLKVGWTGFGSVRNIRTTRVVEALRQGRTPQHLCEAAFDSWTLALRGPLMSYIYGPPARTWDPEHPIACPYTTKPCHTRTEVGAGPRQVHGTRVMLRKGQDLNALIPDPVRCDTRSAALRVVEAINSLDQLTQLVEEALPGILPKESQTRRTKFDELEAQVAAEIRHAHEQHGLYSAEYRSAATRSNNLRVAHASEIRQPLIVRLNRVVNHFAVR